MRIKVTCARIFSSIMNKLQPVRRHTQHFARVAKIADLTMLTKSNKKSNAVLDLPSVALRPAYAFIRCNPRLNAVSFFEVFSDGLIYPYCARKACVRCTIHNNYFNCWIRRRGLDTLLYSCIHSTHMWGMLSCTNGVPYRIQNESKINWWNPSKR